MNDELEILQCLIENRIFAPSPSALAKRLAYKGKMTIYRVMEGKVSFRVVHDVWRKLLKEFHITDDIQALFNYKFILAEKISVVNPEIALFDICHILPKTAEKSRYNIPKREVN